jgi:2-oxoisovalerate dehydrogenase E2 component (dihydrolipoyl transacylase)
MPRFEFRLPDIGEGVAEAEIVGWHVGPGDRVEEDQLLVDVMTDKATVEMTAPVAGIVSGIHGAVGERIRVGSLLAEFETAEEGGVAGATPAAAPVPDGVDPQPFKRPAAASPASDPPAAPAVRRRAAELGIPLAAISGSGPDGRVTDADLDRHLGKTGPAPGERGIHRKPLTGIRRTIAERMELSARSIPHFGYVEEFDLTELEAARRRLNEKRGAETHLTLLPFFMLALARALPDFPDLNGHYDETARVFTAHDAIHIGIATHTDAGLMVPVVRHAEALDLMGCARELARVTAAARSGKAGRDELAGSTVTLTSLGPLGGIAATPIINPPEVAIIGPNKLVERPVAKDGAVVIRQMMNVSSSFDHRVVDGQLAARFIQGVRQLLEEPTAFIEKG